jgi:di/tripeptidase
MQHEEQFGAQLANIEGGSLRNAIPREAFGVIAVKKGNAEELAGKNGGGINCCYKK